MAAPGTNPCHTPFWDHHLGGAGYFLAQAAKRAKQSDEQVEGEKVLIASE
jgi:hypothetical protein